MDGVRGEAHVPLEAWGISPDGARVTPLGGGTANLNLLVHSGRARYVLRRRNSRYCSDNQLAFDHALMRHLAGHGLAGPNPLPTREGNTWLRQDGHVYELHPFVEGVAFDWDDPVHLDRAARTLRRFHDATADFAPPVVKAYPREDDPADLAAGIEDLRGVLNDPAESGVLDELARWTSRLAQTLPGAVYYALPCQTIHGDFHPGNVCMPPNGGAALFDLDCASWQPRARDVADACLYFCARRDGPFDASNIVRLTRECWLEPGRNRRFLDAYGGLSAEESDALPWLIAARWMYSRVRGRLKLNRAQWPGYATAGVLTPLRQLEEWRLRAL